MSEEALTQMMAVVVGGLLAIGGGFLTTILVDNRRLGRDRRNLALAFKGEITALLAHMDERHYLARIQEVVEQIEQSGKPFYMPVRFRYQYDRVYDSNVERIGMLRGRLPEMLPLFYTRLSSIMEDMYSLGEGNYASLDLPVLVRVYRDLHRILAETMELGWQIVAETEGQYQGGSRPAAG